VWGAVVDRAVSHDGIAIAVKGTFSSVRVLEGAGAQLGFLSETTRPGEDVPFLLIVPDGIDVTDMPVVAFHNGADGSLSQAFVFAKIAADAGVAVIGLETYLHGERSPSPIDDYHALRGDPCELGPDGFAEQSAASLVLQFLGLDMPSDQKGSPSFTLGALAQMAADYHALLRVVTTSDLSAIAAADDSLAGIGFDGSRVFYVGGSMGTVVGSIVLAADSVVSAEVLVFPALAIPNDDYEPDRHLIPQPLTAFYKWVLYPTEPIALARSIVTARSTDAVPPMPTPMPMPAESMWSASLPAT
jgi:hypothetical protein